MTKKFVDLMLIRKINNYEKINDKKEYPKGKSFGIKVVLVKF